MTYPPDDTLKRELTEQEQALAEKLVRLIQLIPEVQADAAEVRKHGGDVQYAVMSQFPEDAHPALAMQWPVISMFLGV